jgi:hypothetical protein
MTMKQNDHHDQPPPPMRETSRRARLEALLFTAASLGTTLVTLGLLGDTKLPKVQGE